MERILEENEVRLYAANQLDNLVDEIKKTRKDYPRQRTELWPRRAPVPAPGSLRPARPRPRGRNLPDTCLQELQEQTTQTGFLVVTEEELYAVNIFRISAVDRKRAIPALR